MFDHLGDMQLAGLGEQGIFLRGTRHISELVLHLWNARPLLLSSAIKTNNFLFTADLTNLDVGQNDKIVVPRGTFHLQRSRFLWRETCYEEFAFINYGAAPVDIPVSVNFDADFADIFEVRGMSRPEKGQRLPNEIGEQQVLLSYEGLDKVVRRTLIHCDSRPEKITATEIQFHVHLEPSDRKEFRLAISCDARPEHPITPYEVALERATEEQRTEAEAFPRIGSSNSRLSDWLEHSVADVQMMITGNPEVNYPYAGVPWFSTVFGRDGIITALQMLWLNPAIAKGVLEYLAQTQATEVNIVREAEPGKILHETRSGEMAALGEIPFGRYYGSVDSTPLFVMLAGQYFERTGDREFARRLWPHIELALQWIDKFGDLDGDGFVEYAQRSSKGLVQQGWKDSNDSVFHADGTLAEAPIALCEVQGYAYAAKLAAAQLSRATGHEHLSDKLEAEAETLRRKFEEAFWCEDLSTYALALDRNNKPCRVRTSNAGHCLFTGIAESSRALRVVDTLMQPDSFSGWGIRTVASGQARYNPLSYHNGSVWPHDNSMVAGGVARYGRKDVAGQILMGLLDASRWAELYRLPELFSGLERRGGEGPTLYPVACSPQAWSAGAVFLLVQSCLGISVDGIKNRVVFDRPYLPEGVPQLWVKGLRVGQADIDLFFHRTNDAVRIEVTRKSGEVEIVSPESEFAVTG